MKKRKMLVTIMALAILCASPALAAGVSGRMNSSNIEVIWQTGAGMCELTLYQDGWPVCVRNVNGGSGSVSIPVGEASGRYSLRLKTAEGCYTADVKVPKPTEKPVELPTEAPAEKPTEVPTTTPEPTKVATPEPTQAPTAKPTAAPTKAPVSVVNRDDLAAQVLTLVNEERASRGLGALRMDSELTRAACVRAGEIAQSFSHTRPDGSSWSTVSTSAYGENIAMGQQTAEKVVAAWMTSTGHRENILRESYGSIGICAYKVNGVMYWVQLFGR